MFVFGTYKITLIFQICQFNIYVIPFTFFNSMDIFFPSFHHPHPALECFVRLTQPLVKLDAARPVSKKAVINNVTAIR